jgi:hypothetical protein
MVGLRLRPAFVAVTELPYLIDKVAPVYASPIGGVKTIEEGSSGAHGR